MGRLQKNFKFLGMICLLGLLLVISLGCASIVSKSEWPIRIASSPEQADVTITDVTDGKKIFTGKTPTTVTLSSRGGYFKGKTYKVDLSKDDYVPQSIEIKSAMNGWYIGNILFGGLIGLLIVDPATGAMWSLDPKDVNLILEKKIAAVPSDQKSLSVVSLKDVPDDLRDKMIKIK